jgi:hypothetical protein
LRFCAFSRQKFVTYLQEERARGNAIYDLGFGIYDLRGLGEEEKNNHGLHGFHGWKEEEIPRFSLFLIRGIRGYFQTSDFGLRTSDFGLRTPYAFPRNAQGWRKSTARAV